MAQYDVHEADMDYNDYDDDDDDENEELESFNGALTDDDDEDGAYDEDGEVSYENDDETNDNEQLEHDDNHDNESLADYEVEVDKEYEEDEEQEYDSDEDEQQEYDYEEYDEEYDEEEEQEEEQNVDSSGGVQPHRMLLAAKHRGGGLQTAALRTRPSSEVLSQDEARRSGNWTGGDKPNAHTTAATSMPQNGRLVLQPRNSSSNNGGPSSRRYQAATSRINSAAGGNNGNNSPTSKVSNLEPNGIYDDGYNVYRSFKRKVPGPNTDRGILNSQVMFDRVFHPDNGKGRPPGPGLVPAKPIPPPDIPNPRDAVELERKRYAENNPVKMSMNGIQPKGAGKLVLERPVGYHGYQPVAHDIPFMPQKGAAVNRRVPTSKPNYTASVTLPQNRDFEHTLTNNNDPLPISSGLMQRKGLAPMATSLQHWRVNGTLPVVAADAVARSDEAAGSYSAPLVVQGRVNSGSIKNTSLLAGVRAVDDPSAAASKFSWNPATAARASNNAPEARQASGSSTGAAGQTVLSDRANKRDVAAAAANFERGHLLTWNTALDGPNAAPELRDTVRYAEPRLDETGVHSAAISSSSSSSSSSGQMSGPHNPNAFRYTAPRTQTEAEAAGYNGFEAPNGAVSGPRSSALRFVEPRFQSSTDAAALIAQQTNGTSWQVKGTGLHEQPRLYNVLQNVAPRQNAGVNNTFSGTGFSGSLWATDDRGNNNNAVMQLVEPRHSDAPRYFEPRQTDEDGRFGGVARLATGGAATTNIQQFEPRHDPATRYLPPRPEQKNAPARFVKSSTSAAAAAAVPGRRGPENVVQFTEPRSQAEHVAANTKEQWATSGAWVMAPRAPDATRYVEPRHTGPDGTTGNGLAATAAAGIPGSFVQPHNPNAVKFTKADQPSAQNRGNVVSLLAGPAGTWMQSAAHVASSAALKNAETRTLYAPVSTFDTRLVGQVVRAAAADSVAVPTVREDVLNVPGRFEVATRSELGAHQQDAPDVLLGPQLSSLPAPKSATTQRAPTSAAPPAAWTASQVSARNAKMDLVSSRSAFRTVGSSQVPASVSNRARARDQAAALASNTRNTPLNVPTAVESESTLVRPRSSTPRVPAHARTWRAVTNDRA